jgi:putative redox protein
VDPLFESDGHAIAGHLALPRMHGSGTFPGLVISHGYPSYAAGGVAHARTFPELTERIASEMGWAALTFTFRGCGESEGDFSLAGWLDDISAAVDHLSARDRVEGIWLAGFGTGGALSICAAARDDQIQGVAAMGAPADFDDWASHPRRLLAYSRQIGLIRDSSFPASVETWARELREIRAVACVADLPPRPLILMHGGDDDVVPVFDARVIGDAHGSAELRVIDGGSHQLRHDPRAIAILLGWLDRQKRRQAGGTPRIAMP